MEINIHVTTRICSIIIEALSPIRLPANAGPATEPNPNAGIANVIYFPFGSEFFTNEYKVTNLTDRMGMRLEGTIIKNILSTNIRSEGISKGAIQVPADGQPIILLTDYPTIGGYPKIANVISADYHLLVQKKPGEKILFQNVELHEAEQLYKDHRSDISKIIKNIKEIN